MTASSTAVSRKNSRHLFCDEELRALEHRERVAGGDWSEQNIYLKKSPRPGWWQNENNPPLKGIMDVFSLWHVRVGVIRKGIQTGGTQALYNLLAREADYSNGHDNALVIMADEKSVKKHGVNRLQPMFEHSPNLSAIMSKNPDDTTAYHMRLLSGFRIDIGWATSEVSLASESYRVIIFDEISKYQIHANIDEGKGRATTYEDTKKLFFVSSPDLKDLDPLQAEEAACDVKMEFWPVCPDCGDAQPMVWDNFTWSKLEDGADPTSGEIRRQKSARYACQHCGVLWDNHAKNRAVQLAMARPPCSGWVPDKEVVNFGSVAFSYPAWLSPFVSISECVAKWLEAQKELRETGRDNKLKKWINTIAGEQYSRDVPGSVTSEHLLRYRSELPRNLVPPETCCLCLLVDTQQSSFYYEVWSYGYAPAIRMHMLRHGIVEKFEDLEGLLLEEYRDHTGLTYRIGNGLIDSGGTRRGYQKHSRTVEVYEWCSRNRQMMPIKGMHGRTGDLVSYKDIATYPSTNKAIPGLLKRANLRVDLFKDELERRLGIEPDDPGAMSYHDGIDEGFAKHFTSEAKDESGTWVHNRKNRNDYWDCNVYAVALLEMMKLRIPVQQAISNERQDTTHINHGNNNKPKPKTRRW